MGDISQGLEIGWPFLILIKVYDDVYGPPGGVRSGVGIRIGFLKKNSERVFFSPIWDQILHPHDVQALLYVWCRLSQVVASFFKGKQEKA